MMAAHPLIAECAALGIRLEPEGPTGLAVEPAYLMTPALRGRLVTAKAEILDALTAASLAASRTRRPDHAERLLRAKLEAWAALLDARGYRADRHRLLARARRDLGTALGFRSLTAARVVLGDTALVRAGAVLDDWLAALADAGDERPVGETP